MKVRETADIPAAAFSLQCGQRLRHQLRFHFVCSAEKEYAENDEALAARAGAELTFSSHLSVSRHKPGSRSWGSGE